MALLFRSLLLVIAGATHRELARQLRYLKVENQILRSKLPTRVTITPTERQRLLKFGEGLGKALRAVVTIVAPSTFLRWIRESRRQTAGPPTKRGRRRTPLQIRRLILKLARENGWGYCRILGELKKLRIYSVKTTTIRNLLKEHGLSPGPKRGEATWDEFLKRHAASLWQMDFFSRKVLTLKGLRETFVLAFLHVSSRRVILTPATAHPNEEWIVAQAGLLVSRARESGLRVRHIVHDRDTKFTRSFDDALRRRYSQVVKIAHCAPNMQAHVERFIQSLQQECLDHFLVFGEQHLDHLCAEYLTYYHQERPHQGKGNELLCRVQTRTRSKTDSPEAIPLTDIRCQQRLGGLLKHYSRKAA
jgi:putative transposase